MRRLALVACIVALACESDNEAPAKQLVHVDEHREPTPPQPPEEPKPEPQPDPETGYGRGSGAGFGGKGKRVPQVTRPKPQIEGALEEEQIREVVRKHINEVRACFDIAWGTRVNLSQRTAIQFVIGPDGKVREAKVLENTGKDPDIPACIVEALERWRFPKPADGEPVTVIYPFLGMPG